MSKKEKSVKDKICGIIKLVLRNEINHKYPPTEDYADRIRARERAIELLYKDLAILQPGLPEDGSEFFIAFNKGKQRLKLKTNRFLTRKLHIKDFTNESAIAKLADSINLNFFDVKDEQVQLVTGRDITDAYTAHFGGSSCMTGNCSDYVMFYEQNPDRFSMLKMEIDNNQARAIVHKLDNGKYCLDRVYSDCEMLKIKMQDYAIKQGWYYRESFQAGGAKVVDKDGNEVDDNELIVSNCYYEGGHFPYMDTFCYGKEIDYSHCSISISINDGFDVTLDSTDGNFMNGGEVCYSCENRVSEDEAYYADDNTYCQDCYNEMFSYCEDCEEHCLADDVLYIESESRYVCSYCLSENYTHCEVCDEWFKETTDTIDGSVCGHCLENYAGCEECGTWVKYEDTTEQDDRVLCNDCATPIDVPGQLLLTTGATTE